MNEQLYQASLKALTSNGVPEDLAIKASRVVASDDASLPNFGRTPEDQEIAKQVVTYLNARWEEE
ncbi:MAG: hypothetical protein RMX97_02580 [Nostoc sp. DedQUE11]|nr:hypothetical protein [Nostoc sp. SerVER01]MDZ8023571.1 hypothetical protein [Nostoc sp. DedQUE11]